MKKKKQQKIKDLLPRVKENISLKDYTTFKIGGKTRYFFVARTKDDLIKAIKTAKQLNLPFLFWEEEAIFYFQIKDLKG